jgi:hypothetical protein
MNKLIHQYGLQAIAYDWVAAKIQDCATDNSGQYAFVVMDPKLVLNKNTKVFSAQAPSPDPLAYDRDAMASVQRTLQIQMPDGMTVLKLWPSAPTVQPTPLAAWMQQNLAACASN